MLFRLFAEVLSIVLVQVVVVDTCSHEKSVIPLRGLISPENVWLAACKSSLLTHGFGALLHLVVDHLRLLGRVDRLHVFIDKLALWQT